MTKSLRRLNPAFVALVVLAAFPSSISAQHKSGAAGITLTAVLAPALTMSADPGPSLMSFITSGHDLDFPVTINTRWVPGSGDVHVMVISGDGFQSWRETRTLAVLGPRAKGATKLKVDTAELSAGEDAVITFRAQVL